MLKGWLAEASGDARQRGAAGAVNLPPDRGTLQPGPPGQARIKAPASSTRELTLAGCAATLGRRMALRHHPQVEDLDPA